MNVHRTDKRTQNLEKIARSLKQETRNALANDVLNYARSLTLLDSSLYRYDSPDALARSHFFSVLAVATHDLRTK